MKFYCNKCGKCCKDKLFMIGLVIIYPCELHELAKHLGCSNKSFVEIYCVEDFIEFQDKKFTIYKLKKDKGKCVFLNDNLCSIYSARPIQCKRAPYGYFANTELWKHMDCLKNVDFPNVDTRQEDKELVENLLRGYKL